jgi:hypothetical protein
MSPLVGLSAILPPCANREGLHLPTFCLHHLHSIAHMCETTALLTVCLLRHCPAVTIVPEGMLEEDDEVTAAEVTLDGSSWCYPSEAVDAANAIGVDTDHPYWKNGGTMIPSQAAFRKPAHCGYAPEHLASVTDVNSIDRKLIQEQFVGSMLCDCIRITKHILTGGYGRGWEAEYIDADTGDSRTVFVKTLGVVVTDAAHFTVGGSSETAKEHEYKARVEAKVLTHKWFGAAIDQVYRPSSCRVPHSAASPIALDVRLCWFALVCSSPPGPRVTSWMCVLSLEPQCSGFALAAALILKPGLTTTSSSSAVRCAPGESSTCTRCTKSRSATHTPAGYLGNSPAVFIP